MNNILEYDLNVFYEDLGLDEDGINQWADVYTIQPSAYRDVDGRSERQYMESFKLTLEETRSIAPDFPESYWGNDFFISLNTFYDMCKTLPKSVKLVLDSLPPIEKVEFGGPEHVWINTLF